MDDGPPRNVTQARRGRAWHESRAGRVTFLAGGSSKGSEGSWPKAGSADVRAGPASRSVRALAPAPGFRRLRHARLGDRGRGCGPAGLAAPAPQRRRHDHRPAGLADHRGRPDLPGHTASPQEPSRGVHGRPAARAAGRGAGRRRAGGAGGDGRLGRPGPAGRAGEPDPGRTPGLRPARRVRHAVRRGRPHHRPDRGRDPAAGQPGPPAGAHRAQAGPGPGGPAPGGERVPGRRPPG